MTLDRVLFLLLFIIAGLAIVPVQKSSAHGDQSNHFHSFVSSSTNTDGDGSTSVIVEQKIISNSNNTVVSEFKSENGKVITDKTYTVPDAEDLEEDIENKAKERTVDIQEKIDDVKTDQTKEGVEKELEKLGEDIETQVEERTDDLEQDHTNWWQRFRSWLEDRLKQIREG